MAFLDSVGKNSNPPDVKGPHKAIVFLSPSDVAPPPPQADHTVKSNPSVVLNSTPSLLETGITSLS